MDEVKIKLSPGIIFYPSLCPNFGMFVTCYKLRFRDSVELRNICMIARQIFLSDQNAILLMIDGTKKFNGWFKILLVPDRPFSYYCFDHSVLFISVYNI